MAVHMLMASDFLRLLLNIKVTTRLEF